MRNIKILCHDKLFIQMSRCPNTIINNVFYYINKIKAHMIFNRFLVKKVVLVDNIQNSFIAKKINFSKTVQKNYLAHAVTTRIIANRFSSGKFKNYS